MQWEQSECICAGGAWGWWEEQWEGEKGQMYNGEKGEGEIEGEVEMEEENVIELTGSPHVNRFRFKL